MNQVYPEKYTEKTNLKQRVALKKLSQENEKKLRLLQFVYKLKQKLTPPSLNTIYKKLIYDRLKGDKTNLTLFTILVVMASELPLYFFTLLDLLKLKSLFKYRLHYAREHVSHLGIRNYPPTSLTIRTVKTALYHIFFAYIIPAGIAIRIGAALGIFVYDTEEGEDKINWKRFWKEFSSVTVLADIFFWICHRSFHTPGLYLNHHKVHHEFKYSIASAHHWSTFFEAAMFSIPQALAPIVLWPVFGKRIHLTSMWAGIVFTQLNAIVGHAGYDLPFVPKWFPFFQPEYHDFHHIDHLSNFAAIFPLTDMLFGTYTKATLEHDLVKILANKKKASRFIK
eukprot:maker-scaffold_22-snap-gene-4.13-mRNA-1 protein AED:0.00 eAED:0.00 QI:232/1/1/1/1/1/2/72/337